MSDCRFGVSLVNYPDPDPERIGEGIPIPDSLGEETTFINICIGSGSLKCHRVLISTTPSFGDKVTCWYSGFTFKTFI